MNDNVLPCPFCAYQPHPSDHVRCEYELVHYAINCRNCGAIGPNEISLAEARRMWNLRRTSWPPDQGMIQPQTGQGGE